MDKKNSVYITIFTPTYNRAYTLERLFNSLKRQTNCDFEWLIVDDGSIDNTYEIISNWLKEELPFPIYYYKRENGGKHRAINFAVQKAKGTLFLIVDSDDFLTENAVESIIQMNSTLPTTSKIKYAGIVGCRGHFNGELIGTSFEGKYLDCLSVNRKKNGIDGDKAEVFITKVLKRYPFPEFEGEKFVTEAVVWDKMALDGYYLRYFNEIIYLSEYLEDGLTQKGLGLYYKNPKGYGYYLRQSRKAKKFGRSLQMYFDVECYLHWKNERNIKEIAHLIGTKSSVLTMQVVIYKLRGYGSRCKQFVLKHMKRGCNL